jgi:hypothetical protein
MFMSWCRSNTVQTMEEASDPGLSDIAGVDARRAGFTRLELAVTLTSVALVATVV